MLQHILSIDYAYCMCFTETTAELLGLDTDSLPAPEELTEMEGHTPCANFDTSAEDAWNLLVDREAWLMRRGIVA